MSALMIARIAVKDQQKFQDYLAKSKAIASTYGAELMFRGKADKVLNGEDLDHGLLVVAKFPSIEKIDAWFNSAEYQPLNALRDEGTVMEMTTYAEMA